MHLTKRLTRTLCAIGLAASHQSFAATETVDPAKIQVLVTSKLYTGCAAKMDRSVSLPNCVYPNYVHFDCDSSANSGSSKSLAQTKWANAQLAAVTGGTTYIIVDDSKVKDGVCWAERINVTP